MINNIVMFCDECIGSVCEQPSPKRKGSATNYVQRTLDSNMSLITPPVNDSPSQKTVSKPSNQNLFESIQQELKNNTSTLTALKASVEAMHGTVIQQKQTVDQSIVMNKDNIELIKMSLNENHSLMESIKKQSYSNVVKGSLNKQKRSDETPRSSRASKAREPNERTAPANSGTSSNVIGKPLSPIQSRPKTQRKKPEKAVWLSRLHRDTNVEEIESYMKNKLGVTAIDQLEVRKLVKKDRDISTYSFVSFKIGCPVNLFDTLSKPSNWPSYCQIREFKLDMNASAGVRLTENANSPKNVMSPPTVQQNQNQNIVMEMI